MRVLLVNDVALDQGWGTERHVAQLAQALQTAGHDVDVFAGEIVHEGWRKALDLWDPFARRALARRAEQFRPDVVHYHNVLRELSAAVLGVPRWAGSVLTVHDFRVIGGADPSAGGFGRIALRSAADRLGRTVARRRVDVTVAVSATIATHLRQAGFTNVEPVPCFTPDPAGTDVLPIAGAHDIVFAGRLAPDKGPSVLVDAFERIAGRHPGARLLLAGDGPERAAIAARAARQPRVELLGRLTPPEVAALMGRSRVVVLPSIPSTRREGVPLTLLEAAALGRPVVASNDPGIEEAMTELGGGLVVLAGDVAALADALDRLLTDDELATALGTAGRSAVQATRGESVVVPRLTAIYERAAASGRARVRGLLTDRRLPDDR